MTWRPPAAVWLAILLCAAVWGAVILWGWSGHRQAERARAELATERAVHAVQIAGYQTTLAGVTRDLERRMQDTLASVLATHTAVPVAVATIEVRVTDTVTVYAYPTTPGDIWRAHIRDGPLWADLTINEIQRSVAMAYQVTAQCELVGSIMPDSRLMVAARGVDERVGCNAPALYWRPPEVPEPGFPWDCMLTAGGTGAAAAATRSWEVLAAGSLLTLWRCLP